jgi:hypothetical protein
MIFIKLGQFPFESIQLTQYYCSLINMTMWLFVTVKYRGFDYVQSDTVLPNVGRYRELDSLFACRWRSYSKLTMIFKTLGLFSFGTIHLTQYYSSIIKNMSLFEAVRSRRIADNQLENILQNIGIYIYIYITKYTVLHIDGCRIYTINDFQGPGKFLFGKFRHTQYYSSLSYNNILWAVGV